MRDGAMAHLKTACGPPVGHGPPVGNHWLRWTKINKFQCRKCMNALWLQLMVTNRETGLATELFAGFSLCVVL